MRAALWYNNRDIRLTEVPTPEPGPKEMLVKVMSCGICGSDIVEWYRLPRAPLIQGHELGAQVAQVGEAVTAYKPGDRVMIAPKVPCLECHYCREEHYPVCPNVKVRLPGGYAEYILVPEALIDKGTYRLPDTVSYDESTFVEPLACVVRSQKLAGVKDGFTVLVMGCGMSGLLQVKLAKSKGCRVVAADVNPARRELAKKNGADVVVDVVADAAGDVPARLIAETGRKADVVILCTSAMSAIDQAWKCVDKGGAVVFFAVPGPEKQVTIPLNEFWTQEIRVLTSYYCGPPDIAKALRLIETRTIEVEDMITHRLPLAEIVRGFQLVLEGRESIKVIVRPQE
jgi:L-iditol 2-dehydrogenase